MDHPTAHVAGWIVALGALSLAACRCPPTTAPQSSDACSSDLHTASGEELSLVTRAFTEVLREDMTTDRYSGPGTWAALRASGDKMLVDTEGPGEVLVLPEPQSAFEVMQDPEAQIERARQTSRPAHYISFLHLEASGGNAVNIVVTAGSFSATGHNAFWSGTYCAVDERDRVRIVELSRVWSD